MSTAGAPMTRLERAVRWVVLVGGVLLVVAAWVVYLVAKP